MPLPLMVACALDVLIITGPVGGRAMALPHSSTREALNGISSVPSHLPLIRLARWSRNLLPFGGAAGVANTYALTSRYGDFLWRGHFAGWFW